MRLAMMTVGALALAGCTTGAEMSRSDHARADRELADALKGRTAGEPRDCINSSSVSGPRVIDGRTLLYTEGRRVWRAELVAECPGLSPFDTIVVELHGGQICRNDQFRALEPGTAIPGPYCRFARFVPYTK